MAMRDMLRKVTGERPRTKTAAPAYAAPVLSPLSPGIRLALLDAFESADMAWLWTTDAAGHLTYISPGAARAFDQARVPLGRPLAELFDISTDLPAASGERSLPLLLGGRARFRDLPVRLRGESRSVAWSLSGHPAFDEAGVFQGFRGIARDISESLNRDAEEARVGQYDALTGLANRHRMGSRLENILAALNMARRPCALLMLDLDRFKQVNDALGHPAGDELLRQVGQRLQHLGVPAAEVGRLDGDEFQLVIPDMDDRGQLGDLARKIIQLLSQPYALGEHRASVGASAGIAIAPYDGTTAAALVKSADLALYAAKSGGRGQYRFFANDLANAADRQRQIGEDLRDAVQNGQLDMHYQPVIRACDNTVVGFEALLRWDHPELGPVAPAAFIPVADELNLAAQLGEWALERACRDAAAWPGELRVAVNVTARQFFSGTLPQVVEDVLARTGLRANRLELEITEGVFMGDEQAADETFSRLRKRGVRLALDDFGVGHASLAFLRRAPFDRIKIDHTFVRGCCEAGNPNAAIITAIVSLAGALDMETTAEGVEAMDELELVRSRGATLVQGFVYSRAVPQSLVLERLASGDFVYEPVGPAKHRADRRTLFRRIGVIHEDHRYDAVLRNLSRTGALIEGLLDVPVGTELVLDLGGGQLAVACVRRSQDATQGVEFETPLVSDGAHGLCTRHRVSPYQLVAAGLPGAAGEGDTPGAGRRRFIQVDVSARSSRAA